MNNYCCSRQKTLFENQGRRGFCTKNHRDNIKLEFKVVEDVNNQGFEAYLKDAWEATKGKDYGFSNLSFGGEIGISYCPWCGTKLDYLKGKSGTPPSE